MSEKSRANNSEVFAKLNWLSFSETVTYKKAVIVYKCINKMGPLYMTNLFTPLTQIRKRDNPLTWH